MKNSFKLGVLALAIAVSFAACKGKGAAGWRFNKKLIPLKWIHLRWTQLRKWLTLLRKWLIQLKKWLKTLLRKSNLIFLVKAKTPLNFRGRFCFWGICCDQLNIGKRAPLTHPDIAALVDPLFACGGKRVSACSLYEKTYRCSFIVFKTD